jgi:hypothetical protein
MSKDEYQQTQQALITLALLIEGLDLLGFLRAIDRAESIGPILDPSLYGRAGDKLADLRKLAAAARAFQIEAKRQAEKYAPAGLATEPTS